MVRATEPAPLLMASHFSIRVDPNSTVRCVHSWQILDELHSYFNLQTKGRNHQLHYEVSDTEVTVTLSSVRIVTFCYSDSCK